MECKKKSVWEGVIMWLPSRRPSYPSHGDQLECVYMCWLGVVEGRGWQEVRGELGGPGGKPGGKPGGRRVDRPSRVTAHTRGC